MSITILSRYLEESGGHVFVDSDLRVREVGPEFARLTGISRSRVGVSLFETWPSSGESKERVQRAFAEAARTGFPEKLASVRYDVAGAERWWEMTVVPVEEGFVLRVLDTTAQVQTGRTVAAVRKSNYVLYLLVVGVIVLLALVFTTLLHRNQNTSHQAQNAARDAQKAAAQAQYTANAVNTFVRAGRQQRLEVLAQTCSRVNSLVHQLRHLIVEDTIASKPFEKQFRQFGLPPYAVRLKAAHKQALELKTVPNCGAIGKT